MTVHHKAVCIRHQVRKTKAGWQRRILQSNGNYKAVGPVTSISDSEGEALWRKAKGGDQ